LKDTNFGYFSNVVGGFSTKNSGNPALGFVAVTAGRFVFTAVLQPVGSWRRHELPGTTSLSSSAPHPVLRWTRVLKVHPSYLFHSLSSSHSQ